MKLLDRPPAFPGQPLVLVFSATRPDGLHAASVAIRAELRGLGAVLLVASRDALMRVCPDDSDELELAASPAELTRLAEFMNGHGVDPGKLDAERVTVVIVDGAGDARLRATGDAIGSETSLLDALRMAHDAVRPQPSGAFSPSRRELIVGSLVVAFTLVLSGCKKPAPPSPRVAAATVPARGQARAVKLLVNDHEHVLELEPRVSLLDALRERLSLTGTKKGCDHGQCGACTVLIAGQRVNACLTLAVMAEGKPITTIEGLAQGDALHPMQQAFVDEDALQCGYCTPGQILSAVGLLAENRAASDDDVREQMSGNICRCGAYNNILSAIRLVRQKGLPT